MLPGADHVLAYHMIVKGAGWAATDGLPPVRVSAVPAAVGSVLATPAAARTPEQARALASHVLREQTTAALAALPPPASVYAAAPNFLPDGGHKPSPTPR